MNLEALNKRLEELNGLDLEAQKQVAQGQANIQAIAGAKQDCQYWIGKLNEAEKPKEEAVPTMKKK